MSVLTGGKVMEEKFYMQLLEITYLQRNMLREDDIEEFEKLLTERQMIIDAISSLYKEETEERSEKTKELIAELKDVEQENIKIFKQSYEKVKLDLKNLREYNRQGMQYANGYDLSRDEGIFFDKRERR